MLGRGASSRVSLATDDNLLRPHADKYSLGGRDLRFYIQVTTGETAHSFWSQPAWFEHLLSHL